MPLAVLITMVIALLGAATLANGQQALRTSRSIDQRVAAMAGAERGLAEAISRLEHGDTPPFTGNGTIPGGTFRYDVTVENVTEATIYAESTVGDAQRAVHGELEGTLNQGYTIFATGKILSRNHQGAITGRVGTNGEFQVQGNMIGDQQEVFTPDGNCSNCPNLIRSVGPAEYPEPEFPTGPTQACESYKWFRGTVDGKNGTPFVCRGTGYGYVIFYQHIEIINPPLVVYLDTGRNLYIYATDINEGGPASNFQVYAKTNPASRAAVYLYYGSGSVNLYAPGRDTHPYDYTTTGSTIVHDFNVYHNRPINMSSDIDTTGSGVSGWQLTLWSPVPVR